MKRIITVLIGLIFIMGVSTFVILLTPIQAKADTYSISGHIRRSSGSSSFYTCGQVKLFNSSMEELDDMCISVGGNYMYQFTVEPGTYYVQAFGVKPNMPEHMGATINSSAVMVVVTDSDITQHLIPSIDNDDNDPCGCWD